MTSKARVPFTTLNGFRVSYASTYLISVKLDQLVTFIFNLEFSFLIQFYFLSLREGLPLPLVLPSKLPIAAVIPPTREVVMAISTPHLTTCSPPASVLRPVCHSKPLKPYSVLDVFSYFRILATGSS